jgi:hypothetical protein
LTSEKKRVILEVEILIDLGEKMEQQEQIQQLKKDLLWITSFRTPGLAQKAEESIANLQFIRQRGLELNNSFVVDVATKGINFKNLSEKQAYCLARFAVENDFMTCDTSAAVNDWN